MMKENARRWMAEQFADDADTIAMVWNEYLTETAAKIDAARAALAAEDYPLLDRLAHTLKGNALMVGDQELALAAVALRDAAKASDSDGCDTCIGNIAVLDGENRA